MRKLSIVIGLALLAGPAVGQTAPPPPPCATDTAPYRDFDFWVGTWETADAAGNPVGVNVVTKEEGGCLLVETWTGLSGDTGRSLNFVDPATGLWHQIWMSKDLFIDYSGGLTEEGIVRLEGTIVYNGSGARFPYLGTMAMNEDGTLTRDFKEYDAETDTWQPWFTAIDTRREDAAATEGE